MYILLVVTSLYIYIKMHLYNTFPCLAASTMRLSKQAARETNTLAEFAKKKARRKIEKGK